MKIKLSVYLKSGKVISMIESNLDQEATERWADEILEKLLEDGREWITIGEPWLGLLIPIKAIECISFEEITQTQEREQEEE